MTSGAEPVAIVTARAEEIRRRNTLYLARFCPSRTTVGKLIEKDRLVQAGTLQFTLTIYSKDSEQCVSYKGYKYKTAGIPNLRETFGV